MGKVGKAQDPITQEKIELLQKQNASFDDMLKFYCLAVKEECGVEMLDFPKKMRENNQK